MKKFIVFLFIIFFSSISLAHIGHYNKFDKIEMEILRNDEVIGYNNYYFKRDGEKTIVKNQYKFEVKLLSATIFKVEGYGEEIYLKDNLISFQSKTLQNKKEKFVNLKLDKNNKKFDIKGSSYSGEASLKNIIGNWWSHKILQAESQISPISGSIKEQVVTFIGNENIVIYGKNYLASHYKLKSKDENLPNDKKLKFDIWMDEENNLILKVAYKRMGDWEYRLKSFQ